MNQISPVVALEDLYQQAVVMQEGENMELSYKEILLLDDIVDGSESSKGVLAVLLTSLLYKTLHPEQDIRNHQVQIVGGYSGRGFDTQYVTPFLKSKNFPAMASSGWLTRSLEQATPYDLQYSGKITPLTVKKAFLGILDCIQNGANSQRYITYLLSRLISKRDSQVIRLARPASLPIKTIVEYLHLHFSYSGYRSHGASRLPTLAFYAVYQCLLRELKRFEGKKLLSLESHTSADARSGRIGDVDIVEEESEKPFEAVEIKHGIPISLQIVKDAYGKFNTTQTQRYYILSTAGIKTSEQSEIYQFIETVRTNHGCQVVVNGVEDSLRYYLRLLENPSDFIEAYVSVLETDQAIKFEHRVQWNTIAGTITQES